MSTHFRSRITDIINTDILLNQGICCTGDSRIGKIGELSYHECFATGGQYFPYLKTIIGATGLLLLNEFPTCSGRNPKNQ
jgi:hypothetical protein